MSRGRSKAKHLAKAAGERFYDGTPCLTCKGTLRYTSGGACVTCMRAHNRNGGMSAGMPDRERPTAAVIAARDARLAYPETFETRYFGDPPPGRSALDQKRTSP
jgi:hypothetical protein